MRFPDQIRVAGEPGGEGIFIIKMPGAVILMCQASNGKGWDHVSVSVKIKTKKKVIESGRSPKWEEMCMVKRVFWGDDETVMELHPPEKDYVSTHPYCLHLWKPNDPELGEIPRPPAILVGVPGDKIKRV